MISLAGRAPGIGTGAGTGAGTAVVVVDVAETAVEEETACAFLSDRVEYMAAVKPAPVAALTAAMIARVDLDILREWKSIYWR